MFTGEELAAATGGRWRGTPAAEVVGVSTDTRRAGAGMLFLALAGERFDAHDFLAAAAAAGCAALCIDASKESKLPSPCPVPVLLVDDTVRAYQDLGRFHRRRFPGLRLAAITGSVGKTSVKEMLRAIFTEASGDPGVVLATEGNTNNQIGVPQNLLKLTERHRFAVIEMGTNHPGEIAPLSRCAEPLTAAVNSIAPCHLEFLGDLAGVAREKSHIFDALSPEGTAVIPADAPAQEVLEEAAKEDKPILILFTGPDWSSASKSFESSILRSKEYISAIRPAVVGLYVQHFVKTDAPEEQVSANQSLRKSLSVPAVYPCTVVLASDGKKILGIIPGVPDKKDYLQQISKLAGIKLAE